MVSSEMSGDEAENLVENALSGGGFSVERIPTADERRADLRATQNGEEFVIEVRRKMDDGVFERELNGGGMPMDDRSIAHQSSIVTALRNKKQQLRSTPASAGAFRVIWLVVTGRFSNTIARQIEATFYGRVDILSCGLPKPNGKTVAIPCYFFDPALCFRMTEVAAIVVGDVRGSRLLLNPWATDSERFSSSSLAEFFRPGVVDPVAQDAAGDAYRADDYKGDRKDERARRRFIEAKYDRKMMMPLRFTVLTVATTV